MKYIVNGTNNSYYEAFNEENDNLGSLEYGNWSPYKATIITADNATYQLERTGFWQTTIAVTKDGMHFAEIKPVIGRGLQIHFADAAHPYMYKRKSFWRNEYSLQDSDEREIAIIESTYLWSKWSYSYDIEMRDIITHRDKEMVLPLLIAYCARYTRLRQSA